MKIDPRIASVSTTQNSANIKDANVVKRTTARGREYITEFESVAVPYCHWDSNFLLAEYEPSMQIVSDPYTRTMAVVLRDPMATASLNNATECKARVFQTMVPRDPFILEYPASLGAGGIVKPTQTVNLGALAGSEFTTTNIAFYHTATKRPSVSFVYDAYSYGIDRQLVDHNQDVVSYKAVNDAAASAIAQTQTISSRLAPVNASATSASKQKRLYGNNPPAGATLYVAKVLENAYFSGQSFLYFDDILPTAVPTVVADPINSATLTPAANSFATDPAPSLVPHVTTVTTFLPNPTNVVQANILFNFKGANTNVAAGFANYGAVVGFAALGAVALAGFAALSRKARTAAQTQAPVAVAAITEVDAIV